jgi:hypothetical protein
MKVTTVRFGTDLWRLLEAEAANAGVSTSQYIREAALARAVAAAAARGEGPFGLLAGAVREVTRDEHNPHKRAEIEQTLAGLARLAVEETRSEATALRAESKQARARRKSLHSRYGLPAGQ